MAEPMETDFQACVLYKFQGRAGTQTHRNVHYMREIKRYLEEYGYDSDIKQVGQWVRACDACISINTAMNWVRRVKKDRDPSLFPSVRPAGLNQLPLHAHGGAKRNPKTQAAYAKQIAEILKPLDINTVCGVLNKAGVLESIPAEVRGPWADYTLMGKSSERALEVLMPKKSKEAKKQKQAIVAASVCIVGGECKNKKAVRRLARCGKKSSQKRENNSFAKKCVERREEFEEKKDYLFDRDLLEKNKVSSFHRDVESSFDDFFENKPDLTLPRHALSATAMVKKCDIQFTVFTAPTNPSTISTVALKKSCFFV